MKNNISIPNPCNENWDNMSPETNGRFCSSCEQIVVDFTKMSDQEILDFISKSQQKVCGRFKNEQVQKSGFNIQTYLSGLYANAYLKIKNKTLKYTALLFVGGLMLLSGCNPKKIKTSTTTGAVKLDPPVKDSVCISTPMGGDTNDNKEHLMGEVAPPRYPERTHTIGKIAMPDSSSKIITPYPNKKIKKKIKGENL